MNLLIKGLKIPEGIKSYSLTVHVFPDSTVYRIMWSARDYSVGNCEAIEISTIHGRLIDADKLMIAVLNAMNSDNDDSVIGLIDKTPTIIEAEQGDG